MEMAVIYGAITLHRDYISSTNFIKSIGKDLMFPDINTSDFGLGDYDNYHYEGKLTYHYSWDNMILSYAHTTGAAIFEKAHFEMFILKMEHILRNIDFVKAIIHIQSAESLENANLFWEKKDHRYFDKPEEIQNECLIETDEWNFGYGKRSLTGYLDEPISTTWHSLKDHPYPARFSEEFTLLFFNHIKLLVQDYGTKSIPRTVFEKDSLLAKFELRNMINYLFFKKVIYVGMEENMEIVKIIRPELLEIDSLYR
jgi:hypothetical protein